MERPTPRKDGNVFGFIITIVVGFLLTIVAIPLLLFVTCIPLIGGNIIDAKIIGGVIVGVVIVSGYAMSLRAENLGVRIGLAVFMTGLLAAVVLVLFR